MAYKVSTEGMNDLQMMLQELGNKGESVAAYGLYDGAGVMADEINRQANAINDAQFHYTVFGTRLPSIEEKAAVTGAKAGISTFEKTGSGVQTSVGYANAGYVTIAGKQKPIPQIANAINSGTSFMKKQPFFRKAVVSGGKRALAAIDASIQKKFEELINKHGR